MANFITNLINKIKNIVNPYFPFHKRAVFKLKENKKWAYISYISDPFFHKDDHNYLNAHQNKREVLIIKDVFLRNGFNVIIEYFDYKIASWNLSYYNKFDIIFGLEPNFEKIIRYNKNAKKVYYATGAYFEHQNLMIKKRTDCFNQKYDTNCPYSRTVIAHKSPMIADEILQIGSKYTIDTYPEELQSKISLIDQSSNFQIDFQQEKKEQSINQKEFVWFAGSGSILKGLDIVVDYFCSHTEYTLHVIGKVDKLVMDKLKLYSYNNIICHGFMNIYSEQFLSIAYKCAFSIYPSASEGGCPGTVIQLMTLGVIPILSKWAAFDDIKEIGYLVDDLNVGSIEDGVNWSQQLSHNQLLEKSLLCSSYASNKWNLKSFECQFESYLRLIL